VALPTTLAAPGTLAALAATVDVSGLPNIPLFDFTVVDEATPSPGACGAAVEAVDLTGAGFGAGYKRLSLK
jgi:hypothetical protein